MKPAETSSTQPTPSKCLLANPLDCPYCFVSQDQSSEEFIGEWAEQRGIRDQLVIATKVRIIRFLG